MGNNKASIYALIDPVDNVIFYIGKSRYPKERLLSHITNAKTDKGHNKLLNLFIRYIVAADKLPTMTILEESKDAHKDEAKWIQFGVDRKWPLLNTAVAVDYKDAKKALDSLWQHRASKRLS